MIQKLSHVSIYVLDQQEAYDFYVTKLGFKVNTDMTMENGFRWLTVSPPAQPDLEIVLMKVEAGQLWDEETAEVIKGLMKKGVFGAGVFETADCRKTYDELVAKGVKFKGEPEEQFYGIEALIEDPFGNWFSMTQRKGH